MLELYKDALHVEEILTRWYQIHKDQNYGAFINFVGIVRDENGIDGLSFDIYKPLLTSWFDAWQQKAKKRGALLLMAHSEGNVYVHESSYIAAVLSPKRRVALEMIDEFVEDFKAKAPIWKYDIIEGERIYADDRSTPLPGSGLLA
ncbi:MAG: molybdenum cofactor biosynthesis protein MoaE [Sulfurospirillum sp.]|nr:MAG: molybdenum cofactor biosynthesis protein MoaE [Sulfurospirillum sp.]